MKRLKKAAALFLSAVMTISVLAGCKGGNADSNATTPSQSSVQTTTGTAAEDPLKEHVEISLALWRIGEALADPGSKDDVRDTLYKKLNITIKPMNITWDDYVQKIQVWAASKQLPDAFAYSAVDGSTYGDWIKQGIIQALPSDLSAYPNVKSTTEAEANIHYKYPLGDPNGKYYAVPRLKIKSSEIGALDFGVQIRKDWMEKVGITKDPETFDEFLALMKAFAEKDPDGNNKNDTMGLAMYDAGYLQWILQQFEPAAASSWTRDEENPGKWIPSFMTKDYLEGLKAIKRLYDEGAMDKDFATLKGEEGEDKMGSSKAGAYIHDIGFNTISYIGAKYEKANPGKKWADVVKILKPLKNYKDGKYYRTESDISWSETYINAKCDQKKVDRILRLLDYALTDEGYNLLHFGIEGKDFKVESGNVVLTPQTDAAGKTIATDTLYPFVKCGFLAEWSGTHWNTPNSTPEVKAMSQEYLDWVMANAELSDTDLGMNHLDVPSRNKANFGAKDLIIQCVLSENLEKEYAAQVAKYRANGYDKLIEEMNAAAAQAGIK